MNRFKNLIGKFTGAKPAVSSSKSLTDIDLAELMPRPARRIDQRSARKLINGKRVLITGAGGTIGSELARSQSSFP